VILYFERPITPDGMAEFNRPDIVSNRENKAALVTNVVVPMTHNISNTGAEKMRKYENVALKSKISGSLTTYLYAP
jgi:hypothetical protein